jgi:hypothetical protein
MCPVKRRAIQVPSAEVINPVEVIDGHKNEQFFKLEGDKMIEQRNSGWSRVVLTLAMAALLVAAGLAPSGSVAYSQRRSARRPQANQRAAIYDRSYLRGYNEGFSQGQADWSRGASRDFQHSEQYQQRDRSYEQGRDSSQESTQGYELGLQLGYSDGYYGRARNPVVPANTMSLPRSSANADASDARRQQAVKDSWDQYSGPRRTRDYPPLSVPENTEMRLRLTSPISTKTNRVGDRFTAAITSPSRYARATVEGHIAALNRSGRVTGKTELALAFDNIILDDGERGPLNADLESIVISEQVKKVDEEGRVETGSRTRDSEVRGGIGAAAGAVIGGIAGGGKGAIVGILLGGAAGVGTVYVEGNKDLILDAGTEMVIRTAGRRQR